MCGGNGHAAVGNEATRRALGVEEELPGTDGTLGELEFQQGDRGSN